MNQTTKLMVQNLVSNLNMEDCIKNSFKNHHVKGMNYINLLRDSRITLKLYFLDPELVKSNNQDHLVCPHNHRYNFNTEVLMGAVSNVLFEEVKGDDWNVYRYSSSKIGQDKFGEKSQCGLLETSRILYKPGQNYYMETDQIHTLVPSDEFTILLLYQFNNLEGDTGFYTPTDVLPEFDEIYDKFTEQEINEYLAFLKKHYLD